MNLQRKLDRIFSEYIRLRDTDENGYGRCISCGKWIHWKEGDAGHFCNRKHLSLRYDEKNVNLQCRSCNRFDEGNTIGYNRGLVEKYGDGVINYLTIKKFNHCRLGKVEYEALIKEYTEKVKQLKSNKTC
jgi:hypothetical protein